MVSNNMKMLPLFLMCLSIAFTYDQVNQHNKILAYYEENSFMPIMHVYYNKHFSKSKQFSSFIQVIQEAQYQVGHFSKIILTDCEVEKSDQNFACKQISRLNENRMIIGYMPSNDFTNFGDKVMQAPPGNKMYDHYSDTYSVQQIMRFMNSLLPNFLRQISNIHEFQDFKKPRYSPKLVYITREGDVALVIKQLGVQFFQRFDMAYVEDLTESVISQFQLKTFPSLLVLKYNYETNNLDIFKYGENEFTQRSYPKIKKFLQKFALQQQRNDHVFHLIKRPTNSEVLSVDSNHGLEEVLDKIHGWVLVQEGPSYQKLVQLKQKYGLYYDYIHYLKPDEKDGKIYIYNPKSDIKYLYDENVKFRTMNAQEYQTNATVWLRRDYVVVGVRQKYGHLCTIVEKALFDGLVQCFIIQQASYERLAQSMGNKFQYGFIISGKKDSAQVQGNSIKSPNFQSFYYLLEYSAKMKVKDIVDDFIQNPVKNISTSISIQQLCAQPKKKCILYFSNNQQDKTKRQYLELQAKQFVNEYKFYQIDLSCNKHLFEEIPQLQKQVGGLIAFHPRNYQYVFLKAKMTRSVIKKFLIINNQDKKVLPFKDFTSEKVMLNSCTQQKKQQQKQQQKQDFAKQL